MTKVLFIVRGLPGSGKSTLAEKLAPGMAFAADDYFMVDGVYRFDPLKLSEAHSECQKAVASNLAHGSVAVANTFTTSWEAKPYFDMAERSGARVVVVDCFDGGMTDEVLAEKNAHGVPIDAIQRMRRRYEPSVNPVQKVAYK